MGRFLSLFSLLLLTTLAAAGDGGGAPTSSTLQGRVLDPTQAAIVGARITATPEGGKTGTSTVSDHNGQFTLVLEPARYTLKIAAEGFQEVSQAMDLRQTGGGSRDFTLRIGEIVAVVTVNEDAYGTSAVSSATKTLTPLQDVPQSIDVIRQERVREQMMMSVGDVLRYVPGVTVHQGENNRDQIVMRANSSTADFYVNGVRDDFQYLRDLYNMEQVEVLKGPNAMVFGRGGGGGLLNRVTKQAGIAPLRELTLVGGSLGDKRIAADFNQPLHKKVALRINAMYENSESFRKYVNLERSGFNPSLSIAPDDKTSIQISYERFHDGRVGDRGIPSYHGLPLEEARESYFGNPRDSHVRALVNSGSINFQRAMGRFLVRNYTSIGDYDRGYQNFVPGAVNAAKTLVALTTYNNSAQRRNVFNQTDLTYSFSTGSVRHTLLGGVEVGRQLTDNFRNTGYFNNTATTLQVPFANPTIATPVTYRQSATDADNHIEANVAAGYVQDQIELSRWVQVIAGVRVDHFGLRYHNNRNGEELTRVDRLASPRAGIVFKPLNSLSVYGNYSVSYLPSAGDQFASLTTITRQLEPEKFNNYEVGVKWNVYRDFSLTTAAYRLDRTNTRATDPADPARILQTGRTRADGFEIGVNGTVVRSWKVSGGYAYQDASIVSATTAAPAGAQVAQVPHHTFSLWNRYQVVRRVGAGVGIIHRSDMFAAVDNKVTIPGFTRADAALFVSLTEKLNLQANVENVLGTKYYASTDGNNNISPGSPRALRLGLIARF